MSLKKILKYLQNASDHDYSKNFKSKSGRKRTNTGSRNIPSFVSEAYDISTAIVGSTHLLVFSSNTFSLMGFLISLNFFINRLSLLFFGRQNLYLLFLDT